jgi:hypothetical protein
VWGSYGFQGSRSSNDGMLCEPENFDFRGVSAKGVHCDSPCSAIVSSLLVTLSSLPFDEMGPTKCDTANGFPWLLHQGTPGWCR